MPDAAFFGLLASILLALTFEFVNGWTDAPNSIATVIGTRVLSPTAAIAMTACLNALGALSGTAVAKTVGRGFVRPEAATQTTVAASVTGTIVWSTIAWYFGLPTSETHGMAAGITGAGLATGGREVLVWEGWQRILSGLFFSTFLGFGAALTIMVSLFWIFRRSRPALIRRLFGNLQVLSSAFVSFSHGCNDAQMVMGLITLALFVHGHLTDIEVPVWVILLCAATMATGTAVGGWRIIRTLGFKITKLEPVHGFAVETGAASVIELASRFGIPLSTTHTIGMAIMGVGATQRFSAVRWGVAQEIIAAWVLTFPVCGIISWAVASIFHLFFPG